MFKFIQQISVYALLIVIHFINDTIGFRSVKQYSFTADEFGGRSQNAGEAHSVMSPKSQEERKIYAVL